MAALNLDVELHSRGRNIAGIFAAGANSGPVSLAVAQQAGPHQLLGALFRDHGGGLPLTGCFEIVEGRPFKGRNIVCPVPAKRI
jgi:hypothetical protein